MDGKFRNNRELTDSICDKIHPFIIPLSKLFEIKTFGYRIFFPDGMSFGISNNSFWTNFCQEKFDKKIIPSYEKEVSSVLHEERTNFFRVGEPDQKNIFLSALYDLDIWNTLSLYRKSGENIEAFYFASSRENPGVIEQYVNNINLFERFSFYFKDKFSDIMSLSDIKTASSPTIPPLTFVKEQCLSSQEGQFIKDFISDTPILKFFLNVEGGDISLSPQEFKCVFFLSRGKTAKEIGAILRISPRTVEGYIENAKHKTKVYSRSQLVDMFALNFQRDINLLNLLANKDEEK